MQIEPKRFLLLIVLVLAMVAGCRESAQPTDAAPAVQIDLRVDPAEPAVGQATLIISLKDAAGAPINDAKVAVHGSMNHAGMIPVLGETDQAKDGEYTIPFEWTMGGDWFVDVTVTLADDTTATKSFDYTVSGGMNMGGMDMGSTPEATMDRGGMDMDNMDMTEEPGS